MVVVNKQQHYYAMNVIHRSISQHVIRASYSRRIPGPTSAIFLEFIALSALQPSFQYSLQ